MKLVTIIENTGAEHRGLETEHGLSFYIDTGTQHILFDFGTSDRMIRNAQRLHISLEKLDYAVCSHSHYDHAGGFAFVASRKYAKTLVTGEGFWHEKYAFDGQKYTYLGAGFDESLLTQHAIEHQVCGDVLMLGQGCWAISNFERDCGEETIPQRFVCETAPDVFSHDLFMDEICLAVETGDGLAVIVGCSHPGIINMLNTVHKRLNRPIVSLWGGAHLVESDSARIISTAHELEKMGVNRIGLCHCSGEQLLELAGHIPKSICSRLSTGDCIIL